MRLDPKDLSDLEVYKLLIGLVTPRPIAFVTTLSETGTVNAAPFSFFNVVCDDPPMLSIAVGRKDGGECKDTSRNIRNSGEFVIHVTEEKLIEQINHCSCPYPPNISEVERAGLHTIPSEKIKVPRVGECSVAMECKLHQILELGNGPAYDLIIGEVVCFHVDDRMIENGRIKVEELSPVARLAGTEYTKLGDRFSLDRPKYTGDRSV
ncbi:flavin reductase family protein [Effusibacillus consociatus]|uniref:Flavin reductase family protein n=1 Tax=Effusibacillus consociatus TaxID=1117041 RepID=A0ABV9PZN4_9BACL